MHARRQTRVGSAALPPCVTELTCHPGLDEDELDSTYRSEREEEERVLCDAARRLLEGLSRI